ncbi:MAG TPA: hypothetical protein VKK79_07275 [Candidatus Lokiarchaeia archaeon]|nr:hypothetical protein [Candidatus Lokiarchaeia archaeon]
MTNEFSVLMYLLTRASNTEKGASEGEILDALHMPEKLGKAELQKKLEAFDTYLQPLGMHVRSNPLDDHWFVAFRDEITDLADINPFGGKPRLAATLLATIICAFKFGKQIPVEAIHEIRQKKSVEQDLKELQRLHYLELTGSTASLTPLIGYQLDLLALFEGISARMAENAPNLE